MKLNSHQKNLLDNLGYIFRNEDFFKVSLTHSSMGKTKDINNQRLEFLGDRVLGLVIAEKLLNDNKEAKEGYLAPQLNSLVKKETCAEVASKVNLGPALIMSRSDNSLTRAAANMGADPVKTFFKIQMPLILPGVISGGLFAFITSFDEVVVVMFVGSTNQKTLPWQMFTGLREQISPTILAVATILVVISIALLVTLELLRRRSERLRGLSPG